MSSKRKPSKIPSDTSKSQSKPSLKKDVSKSKPLPTDSKILQNIPEAIPFKSEVIPHQKKLQFLQFFINAFVTIQAKTQQNLSNFTKSFQDKNKPSYRLFSFPQSAIKNMENKTSYDFKAFSSNFSDLQKEEENQLNVQKGLIISKKAKNKSNSASIIDPALQRQSDGDERLKEEEREINKRKIIEAEKKKMLIEQKIREIDKEIHSIETSVSQRILEETELQNQEIIRKIEKETNIQAKANASELIKKMNKIKQEQEFKRQKQKEDLDRELVLRLEIEKRQREEIGDRLKEEKRLKILEKIEKINQRKEGRKLIQDTSVSMIKQSKSHYHDNLTNIEKKVEKNISIPDLERKKKELETRRNLYKPIDGSEIKEHAKKYEEIKRLKEQETRIMRSQKEIESKKLNSKKYDSILIKKVLQKDEEERTRNDRSKEDRKKLFERKQKYQTIIKDLFKPKIDIDKRKEMETRILSVHESKKDISLTRNNKFDIEPIGELLENSGDIGEQIGIKPQSDFSGQKNKRKLKINYELPWKTIKQNMLGYKTTEEMNKEFMVTEMEANKNSKRYDNYLKVFLLVFITKIYKNQL